MANRHQDIMARLLATFQVEAQEHLQAITANLLTLERGLPPAETHDMVEATFREVHTLKGAARSVSLMDVEALCQALESVLSRITRGALSLSRPVLYGIQEAVDGIAHLLTGGQAPAAVRDELIDRLERATTESVVEESQAIEGTRLPAESLAGATGLILQPTDTTRLATAELDALLLQAEDLLVPKLTAEQRVREAKALVEALTHCRMTLKAGDREQGLGVGLRALETQAQELLDHLIRDHRTITAAVDRHQEEMRRLRMTPASAVLDLFPRMVRDLASEQGKEVEWEARGTDLEVDRKVLDAMKDPLVHLVRNAIDHGIEPPEARAQAGKPSRGRVAVTVASVEGHRIEISVDDDGRGLDLAQIRGSAVRSRLLSPEDAQALSDEEALELVYRSGLTTSPIITDLSGHGLGMAIVKERVESLRGQIRLESKPGVGTTVRMFLPATIATFRGLLVKAGGQPFL
ncbi:MAG: chemotaxis protein CheA, partial [Candidatus Entotheonellia bacterium]